MEKTKNQIINENKEDLIDSINGCLGRGGFEPIQTLEELNHGYYAEISKTGWLVVSVDVDEGEDEFEEDERLPWLEKEMINLGENIQL